MPKIDTPIIFIAFANEKASEQGRLRLLGKERQEITRALDEMANRGDCEVIVRENISPDDIYEVFTAERNKDRIAVFHYAGHANSFGILLESHSSATENIHFKVEGLVGFLAQQQGLRLVFLNACSTKAQATMLHAKGIPNIIATRQSINDAVAAELAEKFYRSLAGKKPIERALAEAASIVGGKTHDANLRDISFEGMEEENAETSSGIPWDLYGTGEWWIGADKGLSLFRTMRKSSEEYLGNYSAILSPLSISGFKSTVKEWIEADPLLMQQPTPLLQCMPSLWEAKKSDEGFSWHALILSVSGLGKTASMLRLWQSILADEQGPVPIYVPLNEFNHYPHRKQGDFLIRFIAKEYFGQLYADPVLESALIKLLHARQEDGQPALVFLLDALNEVANDKEELIKEITKIKAYHGVQVIISTRADDTLGWASDFQQIELQLFTQQRVVSFLRQQPNVLVPTNTRLLEQLRNPMILAIYLVLANADEPAAASNFKQNPSTQGELLYNFYEANMLRYLKREPSSSKQGLFKWIFKHLLPRLGYSMEISQANNPSAFSISRAEFKRIIQEAIAELYEEPTVECWILAFPDSSQFWNDILNESAQKPTFAELRQIIVDDFQIMLQVGSSLQFIHPMMRDFLAAVHILNDVQRSPFIKDRPIFAWTERALPIYIRRLIGEIEGEYKNKPFFQHGVWQQTLHPTRLRQVLDRCRGFFNYGDSREAIVNVLHIWRELRDDILVGEDLSNLYLHNIDLSHTCFSLPGLPPVSFDKSCMETQNWLHDGHNLGINDLAYDWHGNWLLSAGEDFMFKEWNLQSGNCNMTRTGHTDTVVSTYYNLDAKRAFTASRDGTVIRWILREHDVEHFRQNEQLTYKGLIGGHGYFKAIFGGLWVNRQWVSAAASCNEEGEAILWTCEDGEVRYKHNVPAGALPMEFSLSDPLPMVAYAYHNTVIAIGIYNLNGSFSIGEVDPAQPVITAISCSNDGSMMCFGNAAGELNAYSILNKTHLCRVEHPSKLAVASLDAARNGKKAVVAFKGDASVYIWDIEGQTLKLLGTHTQLSDTRSSNDIGVNVVQCSRDGFRAVSASGWGEIKEWDISNGISLQTIHRGYSLNTLTALLDPSRNIVEKIQDIHIDPEDVSIRIVGQVAYSPYSKEAAWSTEDGGIQLWDLEEKRCKRIIKTESHSPVRFVYSPNGQHIIVGGETLTRWNIATAQSDLLLQESTFYVAHHPTEPQALGVSANALYLIDVNTGKILGKIEATDYTINCCIYTPDGKKVILGTDAGAVIIIDLETMEEVSRIPVMASINALVLHPNKDLLLVCPNSKSAASITKASRTERLREKMGDLKSLGKDMLKFKRSSSKKKEEVAHEEVASEAGEENHEDSNRIQVLDLAEMKLVASLQIEDDDHDKGHIVINDACFSPDGQRLWLATNRKEILLWDWKAEKIIKSLSGHVRQVYSICASPDGQSVLSSSEDGTVRQWDAEKYKTEHVFPSLELQIAGCSMQNLHSTNDLPETLRQIMTMYGAEM